MYWPKIILNVSRIKSTVIKIVHSVETLLIKTVFGADVAGKLNGLTIMSTNDRAQKRSHYSCDRPASNGKKRLKSDSVKSSSRGSSQLLQQLVSHQSSAKNGWVQSSEADALLGRSLEGLESEDNNVIQAAHELVFGKKGDGDGGGSGDGEDSACVGVNLLKTDVAFERVTNRPAMGMKTVMNADPGELIENRQSNSVLMNLLVSGCDVSAGYICLAKPKPSKSVATK